MKLTRLLLGLALALTYSLDAGASSWRGNVGVRSSLIFSDNIFLTNTDTEPGGVIQILPFISSTRNGSRVRVRFNYGPSALWYPNHSELNGVRHVLDASVKTEVIDRYLFIDIVAKANQALVNPRVNAGFDSIANSNAFTQTASISVTPRVVLPILGGRFATVNFSPGIGAVATASTAGGDGDGERRPVTDTRLTVRSGSMFSTIPWSINWRRQLYNADTDQGFGRFDTRVGYIFSPRYRADLVLGYDDGDYTAADGRTSGARWELWFGWTPKSSSLLQVGAGQAYYGNLFRLRAAHRHKRWALRSRYDVEVQDATTAILEQEIVPIEDEFGEPVVDPITGQDVVSASTTTPALIDDTFLRDRFELTVGYSKGRNRASARWWVTRRDYNSSDLDTLDNQLRLTYTRQMSRRLSASAIVRTWDHSEQQDDGFDFWQDGVDLRVNYLLGPRTSVGARIGRQNRDSDSPTGSFSENRISMDLTFEL
ncbi:MAG: TIGR03016 family PEP-CTERM system-associated outer membrane protein [Thiohalocapsa sp.]